MSTPTTFLSDPAGWPARLDHLSTTDLATCLADHRPAVLWPVGSVEPHGPHLPLATDTLLSEETARRALAMLRAQGVPALIAPAMPYGVTDFAEGFPGATSLPLEAVVTVFAACAGAWLSQGFAHVSLINHHLEPGQLKALALAKARISEAHGPQSVSAPQVVSRRWGGRLTPEFKSGACHAGCYETSMIMASDGGLVHAEVARGLPEVPVSLSQAIAAGTPTFLAAGADQAYTGRPAEATAEEGQQTYDLHADMVATEVMEALAAAPV